jgi:heat shock protein HspQ
MEHNSKYNLGDSLKDKVSGFTGVVMVVAFYSTGCTHYGLLSQKVSKDGKIPEWEWIDESRLSRVKKNVISFNKTGTKNSGPECNPPQM